MLTITSEAHKKFQELFTEVDSEFDVRGAQLRITVCGNQCEGIGFNFDIEAVYREDGDIYIGCVEGGTLVVTDVFSYIYLRDADLRYDVDEASFIVAFPSGMVGCECPSSQVDPSPPM